MIADIDKDGSGTIDYDEFQTMMTGAQQCSIGQAILTGRVPDGPGSLCFPRQTAFAASGLLGAASELHKAGPAVIQALVCTPEVASVRCENFQFWFQRPACEF